VVEQQSAHISAEWQLLLGCLLCRRSGSGSDLGVACALLHAVAWALLHADNVGS
jgi:hypothetical protein